MTDRFSAIVVRSRAWFEQAHAAGWLDEADLARAAAVEQGTPADLFIDQQARPLVVAFFGGTGVGKSSLLNRLAGEPVARTGVERPTSREVTVYVHESVELAELPPELPIEPVRIKRHSSVPHRNVLWIDAPDIDSTAETNRRAALAWLPHIDLVCYVVSPERYRDDVGWRVVRQRGHKHAWMFVLNRWDEGDPRQAEDFARMLREAGFENPLLLRTCCLSGRPLPSADQFDQIQAALAGLLQAHGVRELTRLGHRARLQELRSAVEAAEQRLGDEALWQELAAGSRTRWTFVTQTILAGIEWSMRVAAGQFAAREGGVLGLVQRGLSVARGQTRLPNPQRESEGRSVLAGVAGSDRGKRIAETDWAFTEHLWDDWAQSKVTAWLDTTELAVRHQGLSAGPLRQRLEVLAKKAGTEVAQNLRDNVRAALARPGTALGRWARCATGFLTAFLPAVALVRVAWAVVQGYEAAAAGGKPYLGSDFLIHSVLLVLLAWALPYTLDRLLRPSIERTVVRALRTGLQVGLDEVGDSLDYALRQSAAEAVGLSERARKLLTDAKELNAMSVDTEEPALTRLLARA